MKCKCNHCNAEELTLRPVEKVCPFCGYGRMIPQEEIQIDIDKWKGKPQLRSAVSTENSEEGK